ncbi:hypothetical protein [Catenuloplanes japonicus]|uniref:hypothetical protein n=1 Tax=Catenuloplanes japonicus TaxID=33876 RepID=UPI00068C4C34|nr:hypothetical protein [Catenuloplanes japonicus]
MTRRPLARGCYRLSGSVLTHPSRGAAAVRTAAQAPPDLLRIVTDPRPDGPPTVLRTALAAWGTVPVTSTHHLVLQDDMRLADRALDRVLDAIETAPDAALALFAIWDSRNGAAVRAGALRGDTWVRAVGEYTPCAALVLPREVALGFADHVRRDGDGGWPDDILMQRYLRVSGVRCLIAAPNLAEHLDGPSIAGNAWRGPRRSACFLPAAPDTPPRIADRTPALVPFFKNGVAQCVERAPDGTWLHLETEDRLRLRGVPEESLSPPPVPGLDPATAGGVWLTGYALGLLQREADSENPATVRRATLTPCTASAPRPAANPAAVTPDGPRPAVNPAAVTPRGPRSAVSRPPVVPRGPRTAVNPAAVVEALRTIGPGGASQRPGEQPSERDLMRIADLACRAVDAGRTGELRPMLPSRRIALRPDGGALTAHVAARLTELGAAVTVADGGADPLAFLGRGHLYGPGVRPGTGPGDVIGGLVRAALRARPIVLTDALPPLVLPMHVRALALAVAAGERLAGHTAYPLMDFALIVADVVRPVRVEDRRTRPGTTAESVPDDGELRFRLHQYAQWLAYEGGHGDGVSTTAGEASAR